VDLFRHGLLGVHEFPVGASALLLVALTAASALLAVAVLDRRSRA
jgi:hypothetical protein